MLLNLGALGRNLDVLAKPAPPYPTMDGSQYPWRLSVAGTKGAGMSKLAAIMSITVLPGSATNSASCGRSICRRVSSRALSKSFTWSWRTLTMRIRSTSSRCTPMARRWLPTPRRHGSALTWPP